MKKFKILLSILVAILCTSFLPTTASATDVSTITPTSLITGDEDTSSIDDYTITVPVSSKEVVVPVSMKYKGLLNLNITGTVLPSYVNLQLYSDKNCNSKVGYSGYLSSTSFEDSMEIDIPAKGTYYLKITMSNYSESDAELSIIAYSFSAEDKVLKNNTWVGSYPLSYNQQIYHKITIAKSGYIKVEANSLEEYNSLYATLCNSKKTSLTESTYLSSSQDYTTHFAVKKGTYYIAIKASNPYKLKYKFTAITDKGASAKGKATSIKKGQTVKGLIFAEDSTSKYDWFKVKLTKKQELKLDLVAYGNYSLKFQIIPANSRVIIWGDTMTLYEKDSKSFYSSDKFPAGTYYIKVSKSQKKSSGYYTIKFK